MVGVFYLLSPRASHQYQGVEKAVENISEARLYGWNSKTMIEVTMQADANAITVQWRS